MRSSLPSLALCALFACGGASTRPVASSGAGAAAAAGADAVADRVMQELVPLVQIEGAPPVRYRLGDRLDHYRVPGVSVAVVDAGRIAWARGFGVKQVGGRDPVTPTTLFEAGSISKPVTATATLRLVAEGKLSLDDDVDTYLRSWKLPQSELTSKEKVTLRRILSHTAGTTVHGFPGYAPGEPLPTLPQILDGQKPANTQPVRVDLVPGSRFRYSGGGVTIEQLALDDTTGEPFPELLHRLVLGPTGMTSSTFEEPLPAARRGDAACAHDTTGAAIPGCFHVYPEMAAAGLWSTPADLLRWAIAIAAARAGAPNALLPQALAEEMLTAHDGPFGLGPLVEGSGRAFHFGHEGEDEGFLSEVVYFPETGQGAAVMVNGGGGRPLVREILYAIAAEYRWPALGPATIAPIAMDGATLDRVAGRYAAAYEVYQVEATVRREGSGLVLRAPRLGIDSPVVFTSPTSLVTLDAGDPFSIVVGEGGRVTAIAYGDLQMRRVAD